MVQNNSEVCIWTHFHLRFHEKFWKILFYWKIKVSKIPCCPHTRPWKTVHFWVIDYKLVTEEPTLMLLQKSYHDLVGATHTCYNTTEAQRLKTGKSLHGQAPTKICARNQMRLQIVLDPMLCLRTLGPTHHDVNKPQMRPLTHFSIICLQAASLLKLCSIYLLSTGVLLKSAQAIAYSSKDSSWVQCTLLEL